MTYLNPGRCAGGEPTADFVEVYAACAPCSAMDVTLRFFANFREAVGQKTITREYADGVTVGEVLTALEAEFDGLDGRLIEGGDLKPQINVLKNGREVLHLDGVETTLGGGDTLSVFPPVAGG